MLFDFTLVLNLWLIFVAYFWTSFGPLWTCGCYFFIDSWPDFIALDVVIVIGGIFHCWFCIFLLLLLFFLVVCIICCELICLVSLFVFYSFCCIICCCTCLLISLLLFCCCCFSVYVVVHTCYCITCSNLFEFLSSFVTV